MIRVDKELVPAPNSLVDANGIGTKECAKAQDYYSSPRTKSFDFRAYKEKDVVEALIQLFRGKCAYCEGKITHTGPIEVEHYRPKGKVVEDDTHPGYWWLAADWSNLLPSCIDCNRERYHEIFGMADGDQLSQGQKLSGKKHYFPILGGRATCAADDHAVEDPLLIDPTSRDPSEHFYWEMLNELPLAVAVPRSYGPDVHGQKSIDIYGLNREYLAESRRELQLKIDFDFGIIKETIQEALDIELTAALPPMVRVLERLLTRFTEYGDARNEFSSFAKYIVESRLKTIADDLKKLRIAI